MKLNQQNKFVRFILRAVDVCVGFAMPRPVRWKDEPFRKATGREWRLGWFFVAFFPIFLVIFATNKSIHSFIDSAERHSVIWLYVGFIGTALLGVLVLFKIAPKVPVQISIPT